MVDPSRIAWSTHHGPGPPRYFLLKNKSLPRHFAKNPLHLSEIKPRSIEIPTGTLEFIFFPKIPLATFYKLQIGP
jgi:hypothetical protein